MAARRNQWFRLEGPPGFTVEADPRLFRSLLANLFENAIRHGPEASQIDVVVQLVPGRKSMEESSPGTG